MPAVTVWQAFSGNNSGECIMVAKFRACADAEAYLAELLPGWQEAADGYTEQWKALFLREGVATAAPDFRHGIQPAELVAIGSSVLARDSGLDDLFPELRALAWKRGALVLPGGIHLHSGQRCSLPCAAERRRK